MCPETDDLDEVDLSLINAIATLCNSGASRTRAERVLQERIGIMFDALDEFEDASRPDTNPWQPIYH